ARLIEHFVRSPLIARVQSRDRQRCSVTLSEGFTAVLVAVKRDEFPLALWRATGSEAHVKRLEEIAVRKKLKRGISPTVREGSKRTVKEPSLTVGLMPRAGNTLLSGFK